MPRIKGKPNKEKMSFNCDPVNFKKINDEIEAGKFSTITELINASLSFYFEKRESNSKDEIKHYLTSEEGRRFISDIIEQIDQSRKE
jgi:hypothetical protein